MNQIVKLSFVITLAVLLFPGFSNAASDQAKKACAQKYKSSSDSYYNCVAGYDLGKSKKSKNTEVKLWTRDGGGNKILLTSKCSAVSTCAEGYTLGGKDKDSSKASSEDDKKTPSPTPKAVGKAAADAGKTKEAACSRYKNADNKKQCEQAYTAQTKAIEKKEAKGDTGKKSSDEVEDSKDPALDCVDNPDKCNLIKKYVNPIIAFLTAFVGIAVTIGIISGGIRYASAGDDPGKMNAAKKQIGTALVALFALLILYAVIRWITPNIT